VPLAMELNRSKYTLRVKIGLKFERENILGFQAFFWIRFFENFSYFFLDGFKHVAN